MSKYFRKFNRLENQILYEGGYWYFVTICVQNRKCILSTIIENQVGVEKDLVEALPPAPYMVYSNIKMTNLGKYILETWDNNQRFYKGFRTDSLVLMPNHIHVIFTFERGAGNSVGEIIKGFKRSTIVMIRKIISISNGAGGSASTIEIEKLVDQYKTIWHRSYYDRIIINQSELDKFRRYIYNNPLKWDLDELNPRDY